MNTLRGLQMESEEASLILEGDPSLKSEIVVGVSNVQKVHKANYYVKKCEHSLFAMGYKTTLETTRVNPEALSSLSNQIMMIILKIRILRLSMKSRKRYLTSGT